jgi:hypothetical protein
MWIFDAKINSITSERGSVILLVHRNDIVKYVFIVFMQLDLISEWAYQFCHLLSNILIINKMSISGIYVYKIFLTLFCISGCWLYFTVWHYREDWNRRVSELLSLLVKCCF